METEMTTKFPVLPLAGAILARGLADLTTQLARFGRGFARGLRNRRDAAILAGFDRRTLADIGLSPSDINDAYSVPFWRDPTPLLRERVNERRLYRHVAPPVARRREVEECFQRPKVDSAARPLRLVS
jgi:uncharacterized protein YjiS (DUF1127 family)